MAKKLRGEIDKFAEMALEAPEETCAVFFAKVSERQRQLCDIENRIAATSEQPGAVAEDSEQLENDARDQLEKPHRLTESNPAEMRALMNALFPNGLSFELS